MLTKLAIWIYHLSEPPLQKNPPLTPTSITRGIREPHIPMWGGGEGLGTQVCLQTEGDTGIQQWEKQVCEPRTPLRWEKNIHKIQDC